MDRQADSGFFCVGKRRDVMRTVLKGALPTFIFGIQKNILRPE